MLRKFELQFNAEPKKPPNNIKPHRNQNNYRLMNLGFEIASELWHSLSHISFNQLKSMQFPTQTCTHNWIYWQRLLHTGTSCRIILIIHDKFSYRPKIATQIRSIPIRIVSLVGTWLHHSSIFPKKTHTWHERKRDEF